MGHDSRELKITALVSRHNSPNDKVHDVIWEQFVEEIERLINGSYKNLWAQINIEVM